jgi:L-aspartate oxidase
VNTETVHSDVLVIGSGLAGLSTAWQVVKRGCRVALLTRASDLHHSNTNLAQGGIIYHGRDESPIQLVEDILAAGAGASSRQAATLLAEEGPCLVKGILIDELAIPFDRSQENSAELDLTREAGHSIPRIIHYKDQTGYAIEKVFVERVTAHPNVVVYSNATAVDLLTASHHSLEPTDVYRPLACVGAYVLDQTSGKIFPILAKQTILATGGLGGVFSTYNESAGRAGRRNCIGPSRWRSLHQPPFHPVPPYSAACARWSVPDLGDCAR